jgi:hypothetical protein
MDITPVILRENEEDDDAFTDALATYGELSYECRGGQRNQHTFRIF